MISRVAGTCFWMHRHLERAENMARLVRVNRSFVLDIDLPSLEQWYPLVLVAGEQKRFAELFPPNAANDGEVVHLDICENCLMFHANGDEPEEWENES